MNLYPRYSRNERRMRAGKMPRVLARVEDWAKAEAFAKRTSIPSCLSQPKPPQLSSAVPVCLVGRVTGKKS